MHGVIVFLGVLIASVLGFAILTTAIDIFDDHFKDKEEKHEEKEEKK